MKKFEYKFINKYVNYEMAKEAGVGEEYLKEVEDSFNQNVKTNKKEEVEELEISSLEWNDVQ